jgi:hypothetical protein
MSRRGIVALTVLAIVAVGLFLGGHHLWKALVMMHGQRAHLPRLLEGSVAKQDVERRGSDAIRLGSGRLANRGDDKASRWTIGLLQEGILAGSHCEETRGEQKDGVSHVRI